MLVAGIKSRPVYRGLNVDPNARRHLFALEGEGALALLEAVDKGGKDFLTGADILYVATGSKAEDHDAKLATLGARSFWLAPSVPVLLNRFHTMLGQAKMGTRIYVSGTEGFMGQAMQVAMNHGVDHASIHTEHRGSAARRVQCVHCKGITENVKTSPYTSAIAACRFWCAITIRAASVLSRVSTSTPRNPAPHHSLRNCSLDDQY